MKTIHKFILKSYIGPMVLTFFIVMFVLMMNVMWRYIDELVGKGLDLSVIIELLLYASANMISMGLPLATLFAAIMTMGNLGENYELLAMKSAGMSLPRIIAPLIWVVLAISVGSFFVMNNLVPYSNKKMYATLYDIRQQKQALEFEDGLFFNGIDDMSIRVEHQDPDTKLCYGILIYDTRDAAGNMTTTVADSGYIRLSDSKRYLLVTLYNGETYEETRSSREWYDNNTLRHHIFKEQNGTLPMEGFDFERSDADMFTSSSTKTIVELDSEIDSLEREVNVTTTRSYEPLLKNYIFKHDQSIIFDSLRGERLPAAAMLLDSVESLSINDKMELYSSARNAARSSRSAVTFDETTAKDTINQLYRNKVEWHRKLSLPVSIMIFFLIGAPLGAIIRKGGLGMPMVVSVLFFVFYYIISIMGEKMAKEGSIESFYGMWISAFVLFPIAIYLTYKATNDSNLFNGDWYYIRYQRLRAFIRSLVKKEHHGKQENSAQ